MDIHVIYVSHLNTNKARWNWFWDICMTAIKKQDHSFVGFTYAAFCDRKEADCYVTQNRKMVLLFQSARSQREKSFWRWQVVAKTKRPVFYKNNRKCYYWSLVPNLRLGPPVVGRMIRNHRIIKRIRQKTLTLFFFSYSLITFFFFSCEILDHFKSSEPLKSFR